MIICDSTYPLPWLLGDFTHIGYYSHDNKPPDFHADFLLVTEARVAEAERGLDADYFKQTLRLRSALEPRRCTCARPIFQHLMPEREPEFHPGKRNPSGPARRRTGGREVARSVAAPPSPPTANRLAQRP